MRTDTAPTGSHTVAIETHGCKLNQADSSILAREFAKAGYRLVACDEPADVFVVNSCTVTHTADRKARHALRSARRRNPNATVVATGCYAERSHDELIQLQEVDLVIGNRDKAPLCSRWPSGLEMYLFPARWAPRRTGSVRTLPGPGQWSRYRRAAIRSAPTASFPR